MTPDEYIKLCKVTDVEDYSVMEERLGTIDLAIIHSMLGITTEAGEFTDAIKKHLLYGKPLDYVNLKEEFGDILWYISIGLKALGLTYEEVMQTNIAKLKARYGDKFTEAAALERDLETERKVLES